MTQNMTSSFGSFTASLAILKGWHYAEEPVMKMELRTLLSGVCSEKPRADDERRSAGEGDPARTIIEP